MFSIILPLYNKASTISNTLQSIQNQTYKDFEVLIINDGSTDNSLNFVMPFLIDKRFILIKKENSGVSDSRNVGIKRAQFDILAFIDADDLWHPDYLWEQKKAWNQFKEVSIIGSKYQKVEEGEKIIYDLESKVEAYEIEDYFKHAAKDLLFWTSSLTIKKHVFEKIGYFNNQLKAGEDLDVWFRTMFHYKGAYIPKIIAYYVNTVNQNINKFNLPPIREHVVGQMMDTYQPLLQKGNKEFDRFIFKFISKYLLLYYFQGEARHEVRRILDRIPIYFKISNPVFLMYIIPYKTAKYIFDWKVD